VWPGIFLVKVEEDGYNKNFEFTLHNLDLFPATRQREVLSQLPQVTVKSGGISRVDVVIHHSAAISGHVSFDSGGALIGPNGDITATLVRSDLLKDDNGQPLQNGSSGLFTESAAPMTEASIASLGCRPENTELIWICTDQPRGSRGHRTKTASR